ncbi:MAG: SGNH/GDSL hydrolase family protein [Algoriphagus sp.]|uniref:SGNH/GDSL hydrolase family protein n=1 Tax=Algoriphagus sp. TaxID=1872435 RepID=UPI00262D79BF|nr:SGNH/GDSL hydrolase family protein [Algoriphagus sp.]MDG1276605.1 SGNH/GDSL hydrolase family protein [Algoriphagus sp.]
MAFLKTIFILFLVSLISFCNALAQKNYEISDDAKQILFLGNSITYSGEYLAYVETIYRLNNPESKLEWINLGLPSETVSGLSEEGHAGGAFPRPDLHERLDRIFSQIQPDLVFANYGMNDGIYLPFDTTRFNKYAGGMRWLNSKIQAINATPIFVTPPIYDPEKGIPYSLTLDFYADWLIAQKSEKDWNVIDIHFPMKAYLETQRKTNPSFYLAKDGVHPNSTGHWLMAKPILEFLGITDSDSFITFEESIADYPNGLEVFILILQKQKILRDAYLSKTQHLRPGIPEGLPLIEAEKQVELLENQIRDLLVSK